MTNAVTKDAVSLMEDYAERTGLTSERAARRYLWTDAFAVCNFLGLARATGGERYRELALRLVDEVHHTLGRHRSDDLHSGWISGLSEQEGELHPTRGGLRIGKQLPERAPAERFDERLEWERDGQYFHYLTKWMQALDQVARATGQSQFNVWARELAEAAFRTFTYPVAAGRPRRMYWKMNVDLTRPLVTSMGQHDPLDGYITYREIVSTADELSESAGGPRLADEIRDLEAMVRAGNWATNDPLGIGGLLVDAFRVQRLLRHGVASNEHLLETLLAAALAGLRDYAESGGVRLPVEYRLAFRELGLTIGLHALELLWRGVEGQAKPSSASPEVRARLQALMKYAPLREQIESFWRNPDHRRADTWSEHRDINEVMLATSLVPEGFLIKSAMRGDKNVPSPPRGGEG